MAMKIVDGCISCGACEPECPNQAITSGDPIYLIDAEKCTECVGAFDSPKCKEVCPVDDCIVVDPAHTESKEALQAKYQRLHGKRRGREILRPARVLPGSARAA